MRGMSHCCWWWFDGGSRGGASYGDSHFLLHVKSE